MILAAALILSTVSRAQGTDFSGTWALDEQQSQSADALFALQEMSWVARKVAVVLDARATIDQTDERMTVTFNNFTGTHSQVLFFDGQPHQTVNPAGMATTLTAWWQGDVLVASGPVDIEGQTSTMTTRRSLSADGQAMTVQLQLINADGEQASTRRVYTRQ